MIAAIEKPLATRTLIAVISEASRMAFIVVIDSFSEKARPTVVGLIPSLPRACRSRSLMTHPLMAVEPHPNVRDGIFVKRLVKTLRYVTDMGRCQYVVQRPERVRRRQRLNIKYVDRRASE